MKKEYDIFLRYSSLFALLYFFISTYFLVPITHIFLLISYWFLKLITKVQYIGGELLVNSEVKFLIIDACIAPSAYVFISIIFLTLPIPFIKNISLLLKALLAFTIINLLRILFFMWVHVQFGIEVFNKFHYIFYEGVSGILMAAIIIYYLKNNHTKKTYPLFTDVKDLVKEIRKGKQ